MNNRSERKPGRGSGFNPPVRYQDTHHEAIDDGWEADDELPPKLQTTVSIDHSKSIINPVNSPDLPFTQSINPYRGCEHGCIYCFARPTHAYLDLSPGLDFESRLIAKPDAPELLRHALEKTRYQCQTIAMGTNTDPYQPIEREWNITRNILKVLSEFNHPVSIVTKSSLIERDLDILQHMAEKNLAMVFISITSLDRQLTRRMEPRAAAPQRRLKTIQRLREADIPVGVMVAPVIPFLSDADIEEILSSSKHSGAECAAYVMLRLPLEVKPLFLDWLEQYYPLKAKRIVHSLQNIREGKLNNAQFGQRLSGKGNYAQLIKQRFLLSCKKLGLNQKDISLDTRQFKRPQQTGQMELF